MIIVSGKIYVQSGKRDDFLASSQETILKARNAAGCHSFIVAADPIEPGRVNVYEEWDTEEQLLKFRGSGLDESMTFVIKNAVVRRHQVSSSGPAWNELPWRIVAQQIAAADRQSATRAAGD